MNWYYANGGQQTGPVTEEEFQRLAADGTIKPDTLVWREGMPNWQAYSTLASSAGSSAPSASASPAAPPLSGGVPFFDSGARSRVEQMVNGPAIGLIITAVLGVLYSLVNLVLHFAGVNFIGAQPQGLDPQVLETIQRIGGTVGIIGTIIVLGAGAFITYAALQMRQLKGYGLGLAASIIAIIPCVSPCCLLGLPLGIWALVVLNKPEVKAQFA